MGVTIYEHDNYNGNYIEDVLGTHEGMPCWPTWNDCPTGGWGDKVSSIRIDPEGAYEWCGWEHQKQGGYYDCYTNSTAQVKKNDAYSSRSVKKICSHASNIWEYECNQPTPNNTIYIDNCLPNTKCWLLQKQECSNTDLGYSSRCKDWCKNNPSECSTSINNYCNSLHIDTMVSDPLCSNVKNNIIKEKCINSSSLFNTNTCKYYCQNNPESCQSSAQNYCQNNFDQTCQQFCTNNNINICKNAIKNFCKGDYIKYNTYCQNTLVHPLMRGEHDIEISRHCNNEGKQSNLESVKTNSVDRTAKNIDTLENPICACYDEGLINAKFSHITKSDLKTTFTSRPQCFYYNCMNDPKAYKKPNGDCNITICSIDLNEVGISNSNNITIANNCGPSGPSDSGDSGSTSGSSSINSENVIDCQMSDWSPCSKKCSEGIQIREKILDPINGGKVCGPIIQTCKIPCTTLEEQIKNTYFNYNDLNKNNKIIFIVIIIIIFIIILL